MAEKRQISLKIGRSWVIFFAGEILHRPAYAKLRPKLRLFPGWCRPDLPVSIRDPRSLQVFHPHSAERVSQSVEFEGGNDYSSFFDFLQGVEILPCERYNQFSKHSFQRNALQIASSAIYHPVRQMTAGPWKETPAESASARRRKNFLSSFSCSILLLRSWWSA